MAAGAAVPPTLQGAARLRVHRAGALPGVLPDRAAGAGAGGGRARGRRHQRDVDLRRVHRGRRRRVRRLPLLHALVPDRGLAVRRVRPAAGLLSPPAAAAGGLLRPLPGRRHPLPRRAGHERGADGARSRAHVSGGDRLHHRRLFRLHAGDQSAPHPGRPRGDAGGLHPDEDPRREDLPALRGGAGQDGRHLRGGPGERRRRAARPRLRPGRRAAQGLRQGERGLRGAEHGTRRGERGALPTAAGPDRDGTRGLPGPRRAHGDRRGDLARRAGGLPLLLRLPHLADDRHRLGGEHPPARRRLDEAAGGDLRRRAPPRPAGRPGAGLRRPSRRRHRVPGRPLRLPLRRPEWRQFERSRAAAGALGLQPAHRARPDRGVRRQDRQREEHGGPAHSRASTTPRRARSASTAATSARSRCTNCGATSDSFPRTASSSP